MDLDLQASKDRDTGSTIADSEYNSPSRKNSDSDKRGSPVLRKSSNFLSPDGSSKRIQAGGRKISFADETGSALEMGVYVTQLHYSSKSEPEEEPEEDYYTQSVVYMPGPEHAQCCRVS